MADLTILPGLVSVAHQFSAEIYDLKLAEDVAMGETVDINSAGRGVVGSATAYFGVALKTKTAGQTLSVLYRGTLYGYDLSGLAYGALIYLGAAGALADAGTVIVGRVMPLTDENTITKVIMFDRVGVVVEVAP